MTTIDYMDDDLVSGPGGGMTTIGIARLIGHCQRIGILPRLVEQQESVMQVHDWEQVLPRECTLLFATAIADMWSENRPITPIAIKSRWDAHMRATRGSQAVDFPEAACAWAQHCNCTHTDCFHGQMREPEDKITKIDTVRKGVVERHTTGVRWCPRCWEARNIVREKNGKERRDYGDMSA